MMLRHARMPLRYLWARSPCRSHAEDRLGIVCGTALALRASTEVLVGRVAVPKTGQKPPSPRHDASEPPVGKVSVPKTGQKTPFATLGCP